MHWAWNDEKNQTNKQKHGLSFETAQRVFDDPLAFSGVDPHPDGDRWQTVGRVGMTHLFVVHTWSAPDPVTDDETGPQGNSA